MSLFGQIRMDVKLNAQTHIHESVIEMNMSLPQQVGSTNINDPLTLPPFSTQSCTFLRKSLSLHRFDSRIVVAYVDSVMSRSGRHLSIHAAPRCLSGVML